MNVPFLDLFAQYQSIQSEVDAAITDTIRQSAFIKSAAVGNFEEKFADYLGASHVVSCGNGTDALEILLRVMGVGAGDEVIVPALSWISTSEVVATAGAQPVFVDIDPSSYALDVSQVEAKITERTKAIIPVHLYGHPANMPALMEVAQRHNLKVIEDCAQAHGADIQGKKIGTWGHAAAFSFFPTKNLGAMGDAGAMVLSDEALAKEARMIAHHGQESRHRHEVHGRNSRMDGLQAAVLSVKLSYLEQWTEQRIGLARHYNQQLADIAGITVPRVPADLRHVFHLYVIRTLRRDALKQYLAEHQIDSMIHYPVALPFQPCYASLSPASTDFPVAAAYQHQLLSLPLYPEMTDEALDFVAHTIRDFSRS